MILTDNFHILDVTLKKASLMQAKYIVFYIIYFSFFFILGAYFQLYELYKP